MYISGIVALPVDAAAGRRTFLDPEGTQWEVREVKNPVLDRRGGCSLLFESINAVRRVRNYPADWMNLTEAELLGLSQGK